MKHINTSDVHEDGVKMLVYGQSGTGKTSMIKTATNPLIISSESGLLSLADVSIPAVEISNEADLKEAYEYARDSEFDTICLDSLSDIAETLLEDYKSKVSDGRQAYGKMNDVINKYVRKFRGLKGKHVFITAKEGKTEINNVAIAAPSMPGQTLTTQIPYPFDLVLRLESNRKGERILHTASTFSQVCKDRSNTLEVKEEANIANLIKKIQWKK